MGTTAVRLLICGTAIILVGCTGSTTPTTTAVVGATRGAGATTGPGGGGNAGGGGSASGGGGANGIVFSGQVDFTGGIPIQGSFTDNSPDSLGESCGAYATSGMPFQAGWFGPDPANGGKIAGQSVSVSPIVPYKDFHGPGTYAKDYFIALKIGTNIYITPSVTIMVNGDSSGSLTFADAVSGPGTSPESGTMTWTCANA